MSSSSSSSAPGLAPPLSMSGVSVSEGVQPEKKSDVKLSADPKNVAIEWAKSRPVITISVVVFLSWFLGYMGYFVVWVLWLVPLSLAWERLAVQRLLRRETRRVRQEILSADFVRPEFETAAWINQLFENCWINFGPFAAQQIEENTRKAFSEKKPPIFSDMALESINMGAIGPKVYNVYVHKTEPHILKIEADVVLDSTLSMEFVAKLAAPPQPKVPIAIRDAFVSGRFCFEMEMLPGPPFTKQLKFCFLGDPEIDVKVKPLKGLDLLSIPGLHQAVRDLVRDQINAQMVAPNVLTVILDKSAPLPPSPSSAPVLDRSSSSKGLVGSGIDGIGNAGKAVVGGCANVVGGAADLGKNVVGGAANAGKNVVGGCANVVGGAADLGKNVVGGVFGAPKKMFGKKKKDSALSSASSSASASCEDLTRSDLDLDSDSADCSESERSEREDKPKEEKEKKGVVAGISGAGKSVADGAANVVGGAASAGKSVVGGVLGAPKKLFGSKKKAKTDSDSDPDLSSSGLTDSEVSDHKEKDHKDKDHKESEHKEAKSLDKNPSIKNLKGSLHETSDHKEKEPKEEKGVVAGISGAGKSVADGAASVVSGVFNSPKKLFGSKKKSKTSDPSDSDDHEKTDPSDTDDDLSSTSTPHSDSDSDKAKTETPKKKKSSKDDKKSSKDDKDKKKKKSKDDAHSEDESKSSKLLGSFSLKKSSKKPKEDKHKDSE